MVRKPDLAVKRSAFESLTEIAFNSKLNQLLRPYIGDLVQLCYEETVIKKELISQVDLGPFKYTVDNGAPIRKAAFNLLEVLIDHFSFNFGAAADRVIAGFEDSNEDVQFLCLSLMVKLISLAPVVSINKID
jgi:cullin-associated NEDD8-dissociated protein 1